MCVYWGGGGVVAKVISGRNKHTESQVIALIHCSVIYMYLSGGGGGGGGVMLTGNTENRQAE